MSHRVDKLGDMTGQDAIDEVRGEPVRRDRFPRSLLIMAIGVPLSLVILAASPLGTNFVYVMMGIPGLLLLWAGAGIWSAVLCVLYARRRRWRLSLGAAVLPVVVIVVAFHLLSFIQHSNYAGDVLHFVLARPYYDRKIASLPANDQPRLAVFNWGGMVWASRGLVYDESDEVALPPGQQSAAWLANPYRAELACQGGVSVRPLWSHYYLASFPC